MLDDEGRWARVCEEALADTQDVWRWADGTVWLVGRTGVRRPIDGACDTERWWTDDALSSVVGTDGTAWLLGEAGVWRSDEARRPTACGPLPGAPRDVDVAADGAVWATGTDDAGAAWMVRSEDGCATWRSVPSPEPKALLIALHGAATRGVLAVLWRSDGSAALLEAQATDTRWIAELGRAPEHAACTDALCLVAYNQTLLEAIDPREVDPTPVAIDGPARCLWVRGDRIWGCTGPDELHHLAATADGTTWTDELLRGGVTERDCAVGSLAEATCVDPYGDDTSPPVDTGEAKPLIVEDGGAGCGCRSPGTSPLGAWLSLAVLLLRRRRLDPRPAHW